MSSSTTRTVQSTLSDAIHESFASGENTNEDFSAQGNNSQ